MIKKTKMLMKLVKMKKEVVGNSFAHDEELYVEFQQPKVKNIVIDGM